LKTHRKERLEAGYNRLPRGLCFSLTGHTAGVNTIRWSHTDGALLASSSMDSTIRLWDVHEAQSCVKELRVHTGGVRDVQWGEGNGSLLSCGFDNTARISDVETGQCKQVFDHKEFVTAIRFHPSNPNLFISGCYRSGIKCWDIRASRCVTQYKGYFGQVQDLEFLPGGRSFISSSDVIKRNSTDKAIIVWDFETPVALSNQVYLEAYTCPSIRVHPDGKHFLAQSNGNYIAIFQTKPPFKINRHKRYEGHQVSGYRIQCNISPDGTLVTTGSADGTVYIYNWSSSRVIKIIAGHKQVCTDAVYHPSVLRMLATCSWDGTINIFQ